VNLERERAAKRIFFKKHKLENYYINAALFVTEGHSNVRVGELCFVTTKTVKSYLTEIYKIMKVTSRAQLIVLTYRGINEKNYDVSSSLQNVALPTN